MFTYLILNILTFLGPAAQSFESRIRFFRKWKFAFPAIFLVALFFIIWDHYFTKWGYWGFNPDYHLGIEIGGLPFEECLFFVTIPFACLFIFELMDMFSLVERFEGRAKPLLMVVLAGLVIGAIAGYDQAYTVVAFSGAALTLALHLFVLKSKYLGRFLIAYLVHLVPFLIVNGVLTALPVVWYNDVENFGLRIGSIPVEDTIYSFFLFLLNITLYQWFQALYKSKFEKEVSSSLQSNAREVSP